MTSALAVSLDRRSQPAAPVAFERPLTLPAAANDRPLLSDFARAMRQVEIEVYGIE
jgi:hypothetical protein